MQLGAHLTKWVDLFFEQPVQQMDLETTRALINLLIMEKSGAPMADEVKQQFMYQVCEKRAEHLQLDCNEYMIAFLSIMVCRTPGEIVMYLTALRHWQVASVDEQLTEDGKIKQVKLTLNALCNIFPSGFPISLEEAWDQQKGYKLGLSVDNMLDAVKQSDFSLLA